MPRPFDCPSCSAPLEYDEAKPVTRCHYCGKSVVLTGRLGGAPDWPVAFEGGHGGLDALVGQATRLGEIARLIHAGQLIPAIKLYRETFGVGLKEAKDAVEAMRDGRPVRVGGMTVSAGGPVRVEHFSANAAANAAGQGLAGATHHGMPSARPSRGAGWIVAIVIGVVLLALAGAGVAVYLGLRAASPAPAGPRSGAPPAVPPTGAAPAAPAIAREVLAFGGEGIGPGLLSDARRIARDGEGRIYAGDYSTGRVQVFDASGRYLTQWSVEPERPLQGLAATRDGTVYVSQGGEISRYEGPTGRPLGEVVYEKARAFSDVATAPDGTLVAIDGYDALVRFDARTGAATTLDEPVRRAGADHVFNVAVDGLGNMYALDMTKCAVFKLSPSGELLSRFGSRGERPGQLRSPNGVAVDGRGRVFVSDGLAVHVFTGEGAFLGKIELKGVPFGMTFTDRGELVVTTRSRIHVLALDESALK